MNQTDGQKEITISLSDGTEIGLRTVTLTSKSMANFCEEGKRYDVYITDEEQTNGMVTVETQIPGWNLAQ